MFPNGVSNNVASYHHSDAYGNNFSENRARNEQERSDFMKSRKVFTDDGRIVTKNEFETNRNAIPMYQRTAHASNIDTYASFSNGNGLSNAAEIVFNQQSNLSSSRVPQSTSWTTKQTFPMAKTTTTTSQTNVNNVGRYFSYLPFVFRSTTIDFVVARLKIDDLHAMHAKLQQLNGLVLVAMLYSCLLYTSPSPRDATLSRMPSSA